jgi:hypothetical protein
MTASHPIALPAALLLALASLAYAVAAACAFLLIALVVLANHGGVALHDGAWAGWCGAAACACATVATLILLTRTRAGLHPLALGGAWAVAFAWPLWGVLPAAAAATLATGLLVRWGGGGARIRRFDRPAAAALGIAALVLLGAAFGGAPAGAARELPARTGAARAAGPTADRPPAAGSRTGGVPDAAPATGTRTDGAADAARVRGPAAIVRGYYRALDRRDYASAWRLLSPAVRAGFGGFDRWRAGYATTLSSRPTALRVEGDSVELLLVARDSAECGVLEQRFAVRWELGASRAGPRASAVTARRVGLPACAPR